MSQIKIASSAGSSTNPGKSSGSSSGSNSRTHRFAIIDVLRAVAITCMVIFHFFFDLNYLNLLQVNLFEAPVSVFAKIVQVIFISTTGMTVLFAYKKHENLGRKKALFLRLKHSMHLGAWACLISVITYFLFKEQMIFFGILHFYAVSIPLSLCFLSFGNFNILFGVAFLILSDFLRNFYNIDAPNTLFFSAIGLTEPRATLDFFPLIPWFGVFLIGLGAGDLLIKFQNLLHAKKLSPAPDGNHSWQSPAKDGNRSGLPLIPNGKISYLGVFVNTLTRASSAIAKRGLWIYLIHQPLIMIILELYIKYKNY